MPILAVEPEQGRSFRRRWLLWPAGSFLSMVTCVVLAFTFSPWPGALLIRYVFESGAAKVKKNMEQYAPTGIVELPDERYRTHDSDAKLDVYFPEGAAAPGTVLPTFVWIHGGAWISGHKDDVPPYLQLIAEQGFTVVSIDFSPGPRKTYPTPIHQIDDALTFVRQQAARFHVDVDRIALAGDSSGAQLASQLVAAITNPEYAAELHLAPTLKPEQVRAAALFCGIYDMKAFKGHDVGAVIQSDSFMYTVLRWGVDAVLWAYTGKRGGDVGIMRQMSTIDVVTGAFPATFISGGNADPLTNDQSKPLAAKLESLGVSVQTLFYPDDYAQNVGHEYQFQLDTIDGQQAMSQMLTFLKAQMNQNEE